MYSLILSYNFRNLHRSLLFCSSIHVSCIRRGHFCSPAAGTPMFIHPLWYSFATDTIWTVAIRKGLYIEVSSIDIPSVGLSLIFLASIPGYINSIPLVPTHHDVSQERCLKELMQCHSTRDARKDIAFSKAKRMKAFLRPLSARFILTNGSLFV